MNMTMARLWLPNELIGKEIKGIRKSMGKTQEEFAAALGMPGSQAEISKWERGRTRPSYESLAKIGALVGVGVDVFQEGEAVSRVLASTEGPIEPDYPGLGIDLPGYERLHGRPRDTFNLFIAELFKLGVGREGMEWFGRLLLSPLLEMNTLHKGRHDGSATNEADQAKVLDRMIPALLDMARERTK